MRLDRDDLGVIIFITIAASAMCVAALLWGVG